MGQKQSKTTNLIAQPLSQPTLPLYDSLNLSPLLIFGVLVIFLIEFRK